MADEASGPGLLRGNAFDYIIRDLLDRVDRELVQLGRSQPLARAASEMRGVFVAATEIAEEKLRQADNGDDAEDWLTLVVQGRRAAYARTSDTAHLCTLVAGAPTAVAANEIPATTPDERQLAGTIVAVHRLLCDMNAENRAKFQSVVDAFERDLAPEAHK